MQFYSTSRWLEEPVGNNAFAWERRSEESRPMRLWIPACEETSCLDFSLGEEVVFEDEDEYGRLQSCLGLKALIKTVWEGVPMVIVDNHNHVLPFWGQALREKRFDCGVRLIHLDQHKDMRRPDRLFEASARMLSSENGTEVLESLCRYANDVTNVGNYIVPAREMGLVGEIDLITSEQAIVDFDWTGAEKAKQPWIFNLDLDFFAPELDYVDFDRARAFVRRAARGAALITIATSPFFMDQTRARQIFHKLFTES